ncbi:MAG TPA: hypothetical protein VFW03_29325 [Gemmatimonadaceae bacterium]|nr:hypothetical protein [Gemmatimonadaceae bacterium]
MSRNGTGDWTGDWRLPGTDDGRRATGDTAAGGWWLVAGGWMLVLVAG